MRFVKKPELMFEKFSVRGRQGSLLTNLLVLLRFKRPDDQDMPGQVGERVEQWSDCEIEFGATDHVHPGVQAPDFVEVIDTDVGYEVHTYSGIVPFYHKGHNRWVCRVGKRHVKKHHHHHGHDGHHNGYY